jgi:MFS family permease
VFPIVSVINRAGHALGDLARRQFLDDLVLAGILGPLIAGRVFDAFGAYRYAFYAASGLALIAFASLLMATPWEGQRRNG